MAILQAPMEILGHVILWKGISTVRSEHPARCDGSIDHLLIVQIRGWVFNGQSFTHYWPPERKTAELYAKFALHRHDCVAAHLIRIAVSDAFLEAICIYHLEFNDEWKGLVYHWRLE